MMGKTHAASGVTFALGYTLLGLPLAPTTLTGTVAFALVCAGGALLPDLDHPSGTASNSWGPASRLVSRLVVRVFGPHRHGTHSLFTALLAGILAGSALTVGKALAALVGLVATAQGVPAVAGIAWALAGLAPTLVLFLTASLAIGVLWRSRGLGNELLAAALAVAAWLGQVETQWLGVAVGVGCLAHIAGDRLTPEGQALYWPVSKRLVPGLGLFTTNTWREGVLLWALRVANVVLFLVVTGLGVVTGDAARDAWPYVSDAALAVTGFA